MALGCPQSKGQAMSMLSFPVGMDNRGKIEKKLRYRLSDQGIVSLSWISREDYRRHIDMLLEAKVKAQFACNSCFFRKGPFA